MAASNVPPSEFTMRGSALDRRFLGATRIVDAVGGRKRVHIVVVEAEIAFELAQLRRLGNSGEGVFAGDLRQRQRRVDQLLHAFGSQVAGVGAGGALSEEDAHADALRAGLFQRLDFAEPDDGGELAAIHGDGFGGGGSALHGAPDHVGRNFLQIG